MYEFIDAIGSACIIAAIIGICIGVPCFILEKLHEKTGCLNWWMNLLYGKNYEQTEDDDDYDDYDEWEEYTDYDTSL